MKTSLKLKRQPVQNMEALRKIKSALKYADKKEVAVGYPVDASELGVPEPNYGNEASIIEVALKNNYELGVPKRAFMGLASQYMKKAYKKVMEELGPKLLSGDATLEKVLEVAGLAAAEDVRKAITEGEWQPNSKATIERKGSDVPLIDTMTMHNRATHMVRDKS